MQSNVHKMLEVIKNVSLLYKLFAFFKSNFRNNTLKGTTRLNNCQNIII